MITIRDYSMNEPKPVWRISIEGEHLLVPDKEAEKVTHELLMLKRKYGRWQGVGE